MYKVEYLTRSLDQAIRIAQQMVEQQVVPFVWLKGPDERGLTTRTIACVERTQPSWVLSVATEEERAWLCLLLEPVEVLEGK